jgi:hypothetical protein
LNSGWEELYLFIIENSNVEVQVVANKEKQDAQAHAQEKIPPGPGRFALLSE